MVVRMSMTPPCRDGVGILSQSAALAVLFLAGIDRSRDHTTRQSLLLPVAIE